jgi:hypothetical protein
MVWAMQVNGDGDDNWLASKFAIAGVIAAKRSRTCLAHAGSKHSRAPSPEGEGDVVDLAVELVHGLS